MQLLIKSIDTFVHEVQEGETVSDLKTKIAERDQLPLFELNLYLGSNLLANENLLALFEEMSTIDVIVPNMGGKVHGSLARAGKVRGQTPKMAKAEKRKQPRGRAKRRMQYNRRFVAVVAQQGGKKKGPNSNAP